jgi:hypothetical protein
MWGTDAPRASGRRFIEVDFDSSQFGALDIGTGEFVFMGQD